VFGITTTGATDDVVCCSAGTTVDAPIRKRAFSDTLQIGVYLGGDAAGHSLLVVFPDGSTRRTARLSEGFSSNLVSVPSRLRSARGTLRVRIVADRAPYTLVSVYFE